MRPMKIGALTAAGFSLLLASALGLSAHAQPSPHVIATWKLQFKAFDQEFTNEVTSTGESLVFVEHNGRIGRNSTQVFRQSLPFSEIGCIAGNRHSDTFEIYPAKRWGVSGKDLLTGKASRDYSIQLVFDTVSQAQKVFRSLQAINPAFGRELGACKTDVDLYGLQFGSLPSSDDTFSWTRNSSLGASDYTIWTVNGLLLSEYETAKIEHTVYKMPLTSIACVRVDPGSKDLAPSIDIVPQLPRSVMAKDLRSGKPVTFTTGTIMFSFDDEAAQQAALDYLQSQSPVFKTKQASCSHSSW
jgi:hypothetical protein